MNNRQFWFYWACFMCGGVVGGPLLIWLYMYLVHGR